MHGPIVFENMSFFETSIPYSYTLPCQCLLCTISVDSRDSLTIMYIKKNNSNILLDTFLYKPYK